MKQITTDQDSFGNDLVKHNLVVFRNGEGALKVRIILYYIIDYSSRVYGSL